MRPRDGFRWTYLVALALVAIGLPCSEFLMSVGTLGLAGTWLLEGVVRKDIVARFRRAFTDPVVLVFISYIGMHVLGLLWTEDTQWGLDLCRILLPILVFGVVVRHSSELDPDELRVVLLLFAASTVVGSAISLLTAYYMKLDTLDFRNRSHYISHIRLALMLCMAICILVRYWPSVRWQRVLHVVGITWALYFLDLLQSVAGITMLLCVFVLALWRWSTRWMRTSRNLMRASLLILPLACGAYVWWCWSAMDRVRPLDPAEVATMSAGGERYYNNFDRPQVENGHYVWIEVADDELRRGWQHRSNVPYAGVDHRGQPLRWTLVRYLASMGVRKDSLGLNALSSEDVARIEGGITSISDGRRFALRTRIEQLLFELDQYRMNGNPSGHSMAMRVEFWRTGWMIAKENPWAGVGTGDTRPAFAEMYERERSKLAPQWRLRAHDQYLTLLISFGIVGLCVALLAWWWPAYRVGAWRTSLFIAFITIFLISCLTDDTLETQAGATFFAFFYGVLALGRRTEQVAA